ncbi:MAG TPA: hypothetical protein VEQ87_01285 [Burkholderiales bacterium]|nr:hypothetical protein [Burkholderiales bacterium]
MTTVTPTAARRHPAAMRAAQRGCHNRGNVNIALRIAGVALALFVCVARADEPVFPGLSHTDVERLNEQLQEDVVALGAFARSRAKGMANGASRERPGSWLVYGRVGPLRFQRGLAPQSEGLRFSLLGGSPGPALPGSRIRIGIYRRFD